MRYSVWMHAFSPTPVSMYISVQILCVCIFALFFVLFVSFPLLIFFHPVIYILITAFHFQHSPSANWNLSLFRWPSTYFPHPYFFFLSLWCTNENDWKLAIFSDHRYRSLSESESSQELHRQKNVKDLVLEAEWREFSARRSRPFSTSSSLVVGNGVVGSLSHSNLCSGVTAVVGGSMTNIGIGKPFSPNITKHFLGFVPPTSWRSVPNFRKSVCTQHMKIYFGVFLLFINKVAQKRHLSLLSLGANKIFWKSFLVYFSKLFFVLFLHFSLLWAIGYFHSLHVKE